MTLASASDSASIFKDYKLKPGVYMIQDIVSKTYVDIQERTKELCCRPATALEGKGLWEILPSGPGYTIRRVEPGGPDHFCIVLEGTSDYYGRVETVHDEGYQGLEYIRFFWSMTNLTWDLAGGGSSADLTPVHYKDNAGSDICRIWKLIPVNSSAAGTSSVQAQRSAPALPSYDGSHASDQRCVCTCPHHTTEISDDETGTVTTVVEVTVTTTTKTTRKKYQIEGE